MRHPSRMVHKTIADRLLASLTTMGWVNAPVNFGATPITFQEVAPQTPKDVEPNTVAVSLEFPMPEEETELGGPVSRTWMLYVDVFAENWSTCVALCDDVFEALTGLRTAVHDYAAGVDSDWRLEIEEDALEVDEPPAAGQVDRSTWRVVSGPVVVRYTE